MCLNIVLNHVTRIDLRSQIFQVWQLGSPNPNFTLEGHEKGVNCVDYYSGGDKPYIISGADDHIVKIWDYQVGRDSRDKIKYSEICETRTPALYTKFVPINHMTTQRSIKKEKRKCNFSKK